MKLGFREGFAEGMSVSVRAPLSVFPRSSVRWKSSSQDGAALNSSEKELNNTSESTIGKRLSACRERGRGQPPAPVVVDAS